jgi:myo-inositol-1(or 4)-monophosphatase
VSDPDELLALAVRAARAAGDVLLEYAGHTLRTSAKSTPTDLVSEADLASEKLIRGLLAQARPDDGYIGEEQAATTGTSGLDWIVDPLDGTINYLYGIPQWSVSIAVRDAHGTLAGAVLDPARDELFTATRDGEALLARGAQTIHLHGGPARELSDALVASGLAYDATVRAAQGPILARLGATVRDIRRFGSAALDLCWTAAGRYDAYFERTVRPWDIAAGVLVCQRAGLDVHELTVHQNLPYGILAADQSLAAQLLALVD